MDDILTNIIPAICTLLQSIDNSDGILSLDDMMLKLEANYDMFDNLLVIEHIKSQFVHGGQLDENIDIAKIKNILIQSISENIDVPLHIINTAVDQHVHQATKRKKTGGYYTSFNFDNFPMFEPLELTLLMLRQDIENVAALQKLCDMDFGELVEHPQWSELLSLIYSTLSAEKNLETVLLLHVQLFEYLPVHQSADVLLNLSNYFIKCHCSVQPNLIKCDDENYSTIYSQAMQGTAARTQVAVLIRMISQCTTHFSGLSDLTVDRVLASLYLILSRGHVSVLINTEYSSQVCHISLWDLIAGSVAAPCDLLHSLQTVLLSRPPIFTLSHCMHSEFLASLVRSVGSSKRAVGVILQKTAVGAPATTGHAAARIFVMSTSCLLSVITCMQCHEVQAFQEQICLLLSSEQQEGCDDRDRCGPAGWDGVMDDNSRSRASAACGSTGVLVLPVLKYNKKLSVLSGSGDVEDWLHKITADVRDRDRGRHTGESHLQTQDTRGAAAVLLLSICESVVRNLDNDSKLVGCLPLIITSALKLAKGQSNAIVERLFQISWSISIFCLNSSQDSSLRSEEVSILFTAMLSGIACHVQAADALVQSFLPTSNSSCNQTLLPTITACIFMTQPTEMEAWQAVDVALFRQLLECWTTVIPCTLSLTLPHSLHGLPGWKFINWCSNLLNEALNGVEDVSEIVQEVARLCAVFLADVFQMSTACKSLSRAIKEFQNEIDENLYMMLCESICKIVFLSCKDCSEASEQARSRTVACHFAWTCSADAALFTAAAKSLVTTGLCLSAEHSAVDHMFDSRLVSACAPLLGTALQDIACNSCVFELVYQWYDEADSRVSIIVSLLSSLVLHGLEDFVLQLLMSSWVDLQECCSVNQNNDNNNMSMAAFVSTICLDADFLDSLRSEPLLVVVLRVCRVALCSAAFIQKCQQYISNRQSNKYSPAINEEFTDLCGDKDDESCTAGGDDSDVCDNHNNNDNDNDYDDNYDEGDSNGVDLISQFISIAKCCISQFGCGLGVLPALLPLSEDELTSSSAASTSASSSAINHCFAKFMTTMQSGVHSVCGSHLLDTQYGASSNSDCGKVVQLMQEHWHLFADIILTTEQAQLWSVTAPMNNQLLTARPHKLVDEVDAMVHNLLAQDQTGNLVQRTIQQHCMVSISDCARLLLSQWFLGILPMSDILELTLQFVHGTNREDALFKLAKFISRLFALIALQLQQKHCNCTIGSPELLLKSLAIVVKKLDMNSMTDN